MFTPEFRTVGALRGCGRCCTPIDLESPSAPYNAGGWHVAQLTLPSTVILWIKEQQSPESNPLFGFRSFKSALMPLEAAEKLPALA